MPPEPGDLPINIILILVVLCVLNALTAAVKRALDTIDRNKIKEMYDDDPENHRIAQVMKLLRKPSGFHYADLLVNYLLLVICTMLFHHILDGRAAIHIQLIADVVFVLLFTALADILPKKLAAQASESTGIALAGYQTAVYYITLPLARLCVWIANLILVILRKETEVDDLTYSEEQVMSMLDRGQETGEIKEEGRRMIDSIFEFDDLLAYEIMTPRTDVFMIDLTDDPEEYREELLELRHSRIPVYEGDADNIIGILHIKDYLLAAAEQGYDAVDLQSILREPYFVPETKNIDSLFIELQKGKQHVAILIDEYGGFSGLVSIEDIIEQIVGDIDDEFDEDERIIEKISDTEYIVDGNVYLDDLDEETGIELESDNSETIGGFIIDLMGEIPKENIRYQAIQYENYAFTILQVKDRRIEKLRIQITGTESGKEEQHD
ncbi:MAG: HlyC/CorC family transporter [Mogibacterium sp.]|nr:HlyC/CorC family transporter [Mogibacterium sp.]